MGALGVVMRLGKGGLPTASEVAALFLADDNDAWFCNKKRRAQYPIHGVQRIHSRTAPITKI